MEYLYLHLPRLFVILTVIAVKNYRQTCFKPNGITLALILTSGLIKGGANFSIPTGPAEAALPHQQPIPYEPNPPAPFPSREGGRREADRVLIFLIVIYKNIKW